MRNRFFGQSRLKYLLIQDKAFFKLPKDLKFCQSGEISPHLVTLEKETLWQYTYARTYDGIQKKLLGRCVGGTLKRPYHNN